MSSAHQSTASGPSVPSPAQEERSRVHKERNREAASRCRQKKKQWIDGLVARVNTLEEKNKSLEGQIQSLRESEWHIMGLLFRHKDDPAISDYIQSRAVAVSAPVPSAASSLAVSSPVAAAPAAGSSSAGAANAATRSSNGAAVAAAMIPQAATQMNAAPISSGVPVRGSNIFTTASYQPQRAMSFEFDLPDMGSSSMGAMGPWTMAEEGLSFSMADYPGNGPGIEFDDLSADEPSAQ